MESNPDSDNNNWRKKEAVRLYAYGAAYTAGRLKSHQMLLEKAMLLMNAVRTGDLKKRNQMQNIVAYLQSSLDLQYDEAQNLFIVYGYIWDALEIATPETLEIADEFLREIRELIMEVHRRQPRPIKKKKR